MRIESDIKLDFKDVLIRPKRSTLTSRNEVNLNRLINGLHYPHPLGNIIPVMASNMDATGSIEMFERLHTKHNMLCSLHKFYDNELENHPNKELIGANAFISAGINEIDKLKSKRRMLGQIKRICLDVPNGYMERFIDYIKEVRLEFPDSFILAGNVVTADITEQLILAGADAVKVGIGSGSVCHTRNVTGIGYPQLSAIIECADAAHGLGGYVCSDGGCKEPSDIVKAFCAGADFVMIGGMLAGTAECNGVFLDENGQETTDQSSISSMKFYGMSSATAMKKYYGKVDEYRASEGDEIIVDYKGPVDGVVQQILGGLRSACTYIGARQLKQMPKCATFVRVNR